jgi:hypothetical protein
LSASFSINSSLGIEKRFDLATATLRETYFNFLREKRHDLASAKGISRDVLTKLI